ncbi:partial beta-mannosidase, partial [Anaerolineae bacterium]
DQPYPDRYATLKCQMQFGWDFAPRLRTCGIWDDASIVIVRSVFIQDAWIKSKVKSEKEKVSDVQVSLTLDSDREQSARVVCDLRGKNFQCDAQTFAFDLRLGRGKQTYPVAFAFSNVRVWNPWDRGDPNLYEIEISISSPSSHETLDSLSTTFGIRSFELARTAASREPCMLIVNGTHEFVRGANWVPLDAIPARLTRDDYATRLEQAREANINFLRVWGGGLREKRAFYDLCDELGILVWQEFPFAGAILDRFPTDPAFLDHARDECSAIVCALRNHPSLVVWCGGNEFSVSGNRRIVKTLQTIVEREDGTRPFKPASPFRDESHNWRVWHRFANLRDYKRDETPFLSEFGLQAVPNRESLEKFLPQDALNTPNALWEYHHAQVKKLARYATTVIASREAAKQSPIRQSEIASSQSKAPLAGNPLLAMTPTFIDATQRAQAIGLQIAIEHIRRRKGKTSGVAIWQFNDCAPAISWSIVDYYGTPKRAYEELKRLYSPVLASFDYKLVQHRAGDVVYGDLWLINDLRSSFQNAQLTACLNDKEIFTRHINIAPDSVERVDTLAVPLGEGENILRLKVNWGPPPLSDHTYDLNFCDVGEIGLMDTLMATVGKQLMR